MGLTKLKPRGYKMLKTVERSYDKPLIWDGLDFVNEFNDLVKHPPLHSVVVHIEPVVAKKLLEMTNDKNRPLMEHYAARLSNELTDVGYELTGDTLKWSKKGVMLDGQHRLKACALDTTPMITHCVFGLDDKIFDVIDQGIKRTPGHVLALCGIKDYTIVAGGVRWARLIGEGRKGVTSRGMTARDIRKLATGSMRDLQRYTKQAIAIGKAFKFAPPTMVAGLLFLIGQHNAALAERFADDWQHGNRNYNRNKNFDLMAQRVATMKAQNNGHLPRFPTAAIMVQCFNHWNADTEATLRALTWKKQWAFPRLVFDKAAFLKSRDEHRWSDSSLHASAARVLHVMTEHADGNAMVTMATSYLAKLANVPERQIPAVIRHLIEAKNLYLHKKGKAGSPSVYRLQLAERNVARAKELVAAK